MALGSYGHLSPPGLLGSHLRFQAQSPAPPPESLYFRGPVLSQFDGREWTRLQPSFAPALRPRAELQLLGQPLCYEVTLEPSRLALLPPLRENSFEYRPR